MFGQAKNRVACRGNCGKEIQLEHPKGVLSWNRTGFCRSCWRKYKHKNLKAKIKAEKAEKRLKERADELLRVSEPGN